MQVLYYIIIHVFPLVKASYNTYSHCKHVNPFPFHEWRLTHYFCFFFLISYILPSISMMQTDEIILSKQIIAKKIFFLK